MNLQSSVNQFELFLHQGLRKAVNEQPMFRYIKNLHLNVSMSKRKTSLSTFLKAAILSLSPSVVDPEKITESLHKSSFSKFQASYIVTHINCNVKDATSR